MSTFHTLCGFTIYLRLLLREGAFQAVCYALVSPVIAVLGGMFVYDERILSLFDAVGMIIMLSAAVVFQTLRLGLIWVYLQ